MINRKTSGQIVFTRATETIAVVPKQQEAVWLRSCVSEAEQAAIIKVIVSHGDVPVRVRKTRHIDPYAAHESCLGGQLGNLIHS